MVTAGLWAGVWCVEEIQITTPPRRTAIGVEPGETVTVMGHVDADARVVTTQEGEEVVAAATIQFVGEVPPIGSTVTVPPAFGLKPGREVVTAAAVVHPLLPRHVEVTVR